MAHGIVHFEIAGRDLDALSRFYGALFDWATEPSGEGYRLVHPKEGIGGGLMRCPDDIDPFVTFYVAADDLEATLARAVELGGETAVGPTPIPDMGAFAMFRDTEGNMVGLFKAPAGSEASAGSEAPAGS